MSYETLLVETQGAVSPREGWRLGTSDKGIDFYDQLLLRDELLPREQVAEADFLGRRHGAAAHSE